MDELVTVAEIADLLKLNQQTIRNWIDAGTLPALHIGRRVRVRRTDLERLLEDGYSGAAKPAAATPSQNIWDGDVPPPKVPGIQPGRQTL